MGTNCDGKKKKRETAGRARREPDFPSMKKRNKKKKSEFQNKKVLRTWITKIQEGNTGGVKKVKPQTQRADTKDARSGYPACGGYGRGEKNVGPEAGNEKV